jgi:lipopolysaccharide export system protein LptC
VKWPEPVVVVVARVQSALPILVVAALSGYTWWLVQSTPKVGPQAANKPPVGVPDYEMTQATVERFDGTGRVVSVLQGESIRHYASGDRVQVAGMKMSALDAQGQLIKAQATTGDYSGDASLILLRGSAQVAVVPKATAQAGGPVVFDGEAFSFNTGTRVLHSDKPVVLRGAQGVIHAGNLHHDARQGVSSLGGRVQGRMQASDATP